MSGAHAEEEHISSYGFYVKIWLALLFLTFMTVSVSYVDMKKFTLFTAMLVATVKAGLVVLFFMHIRFDKPIFGVMLMVTLIEYLIFIVLTFSDYAYR